MPNMRLSPKVIKLILFIFCFSLIGWRIIFVPLYNSEGGRNFIRGDHFSEINTHSALQYFYDHGFNVSKWLPVHNYESGKADTQYDIYTHYPALPDILAGFYAKILDTTNPQWLRIFPMLISVGWFFLIFHMLSRMLPDKKAAFLSAAIIVLSNYFLAWADNLHKHMYEEVLKWLFVYGLYLYYQRNRPVWLLGVLCLVYIAAANVSMEPILFLAVVVVGFSIIYSRNIFTRETIVLGLAAVAGFGLHFYQNILLFGSFQAALKDMTDAVALRTVGQAADTHNELKRTLNWQDYAIIPLKWLNRIERYFLIPGFALLLLSYLGLRKLKVEDKQMFRIVLVLLLAGLSWSVAMSQHFLVHVFTTRNIGLFYGFIVGYGLVAYWPLLQKAWQEKNRLHQGFHVLFIGYVAFMALSQQVWDLYIKYGFGYTWLVK
ncbi:hypothetical protein I5M27_07905 [Adhaeribacter sp. BT258]|uniref:Glycosyltransferase RgtA/B/C/D-like domain-containing protein n=1 Tax=Adhaeribacter terrigena TaxID=2793070 RepID=A0ABS1C157_9BACT|nr:hypothetical protein [Adhaeribacter terrigena]MBK0402907.1 hypothetical protein [Adhaeribacter terrigena]